MTKKTEKTEAKKAAAKTKAKAAKPEQLKIAGTGRRDSIEEIEIADQAYRDARDARMSLTEDEAALQEDLTNVLRKHKVTSYVYEGEDGKKYEAYIPAEAKAKSRRVTEPKVPKASS
jgi:hypothetical protein